MTGKGIRRRICWLFVNHLLPQGACFEARRKLLNWAGYPVGSGTRIAGAMHVTTELSIGSDCWIGRNFTCHGNGSVTIGDRCDIAPDVTVATGSHELGGADRRAGQGVQLLRDSGQRLLAGCAQHIAGRRCRGRWLRGGGMRAGEGCHGTKHHVGRCSRPAAPEAAG